MNRLNDLRQLSAERWRIALSLTGAMLLIYFGFILLVAFNKPLLATDLTTGLTLGILLGASVIALAWVLTAFYVRWANGYYDSKVRELRG